MQHVFHLMRSWVMPWLATAVWCTVSSTVWGDELCSTTCSYKYNECLQDVYLKADHCVGGKKAHSAPVLLCVGIAHSETNGCGSAREQCRAKCDFEDSARAAEDLLDREKKQQIKQALARLLAPDPAPGQLMNATEWARVWVDEKVGELEYRFMWYPAAGKNWIWGIQWVMTNAASDDLMVDINWVIVEPGANGSAALRDNRPWRLVTQHAKRRLLASTPITRRGVGRYELSSAKDFSVWASIQSTECRVFKDPAVCGISR